MHQRVGAERAEPQLQPAGLGLAHQEFLEQQSVRADGFCSIVLAQRQQLVTEREQAAWLETDDWHAARRECRVGRNQAVELGAGLVDETGRKEGASAAERTAATRGLRDMHAIAALDQHAQRSIEVFALVGAIKSV